MDTTIRIRAATSEDCAAINAIYNYYVDTSPATFDLEHVPDAGRIEWFEERTALSLAILVAEASGEGDELEVAGWCALSPWSSRGAYAATLEESVYIGDRHRGQGIGKALLAEAIGEARRRGAHVVMAGIVACQEASLALHRSLGFEQSALYQHMGYKLGAWHDVVFMQRHLWRDG